MAKKFQTVRRRARFVYHGFSPEAMERIAEATRESIRARIQERAETVSDAPATPLSDQSRRVRYSTSEGKQKSYFSRGYASMKRNYRRKYGTSRAAFDAASPKVSGEKRDWTLTGHTMAQLKVLWVAVNRAAIGFLDVVLSLRPGKKRISAAQIAGIQNRRERQFGVSPHDRQVLVAAVRAEQHAVVKAEQVT